MTVLCTAISCFLPEYPAVQETDWSPNHTRPCSSKPGFTLAVNGRLDGLHCNMAEGNWTSAFGRQ